MRCFSSFSHKSHKIATSEQRALMDSIAHKLNIRTQLDWRTVIPEQILENGGKSLLMSNKNSLLLTLRSVYPELYWSPRKFTRYPSKYFDSVENQRKFLENIANEFGIKELEGWKKVKTDEIKERGGQPLLRKFKGSLFAALQFLFPEKEWKLIPFTKSSHYWKDPKNIRKYFDYLSKKLKIKELDEWGRINWNQFSSEGGLSVLRYTKNHSFFEALQIAYPEHNWNPMLIRVPKFYWEKPGSHRSLFDSFAKKYMFNNVDPYQWSTVSFEQIRKTKVYYVLQRMYNHSLEKALSCIYPEHDWNLIFDKSRRYIFV